MRKRKINVRRALRRFGNETAGLFCAFLGILCVLPMLCTLTGSFLSSAELHASYGQVFSGLSDGVNHFVSDKVILKLIPDMVSLEQYKQVLFQSTQYLYSYWNSIIYVVPIVIVHIGVSLMCAYGFARINGRLRDVIFFCYVMIMLMPYQVTLVPNYLICKELKILDTRMAIWLPGIFSPFSVYILTKYMRRIPVQLFEQASIDGAGVWNTFKDICVPLSKSAVMSCAMLMFLDYWNMAEQPLILLKDTSLYPLSVFLAKVGEEEAGVAFSLAALYMVPGFLLFLYGEEDLVEGIAYQGGIKG